ncbi:MAG: DoxX family membrane protein [Thaumarchaeota archaeon]|nr:DoxX family membrane protein [Nitrososphaerota archaeon]
MRVLQTGRIPGVAGRMPWPARNVLALKAVARIIFGIFWAVDGALKFQPGLVGAFPDMVSEAAQGQPGWLAGWFSMWHSVVVTDPAFFVYGTGACELAVAICLLLGLARKAVYVFGFFLSLLIWAVPEGFGGPYGPNSTDIGTGIVYALGFLMLAVISSALGPSRLSVDRAIESRWGAWSRLAEFRRGS